MYPDLEAFNSIFTIHDMHEYRNAVKLIWACDTEQTFVDCLNLMGITYRKKDKKW